MDRVLDPALQTAWFAGAARAVAEIMPDISRTILNIGKDASDAGIDRAADLALAISLKIERMLSERVESLVAEAHTARLAFDEATK